MAYHYQLYGRQFLSEPGKENSYRYIEIIQGVQYRRPNCPVAAYLGDVNLIDRTYFKTWKYSYRVYVEDDGRIFRYSTSNNKEFYKPLQEIFREMGYTEDELSAVIESILKAAYDPKVKVHENNQAGYVIRWLK